MFNLFNPSILKLDYGLSMVEGRQGAGKSIFLVRGALELFKENESLGYIRNVVFSNIKMKREKDDYYYFDDLDVGEVFKTIYKLDQHLPEEVERDDRIRFFIMLDEALIVFPSHGFKELLEKQETINDFIWQQRKLNIRFIVAAQRRTRFSKLLREGVQDVIYYQPLFGIKFFENIGSYRIKEVDWDMPGAPTLREYDGEGNFKEYDRFFCWISKKQYRKHYNDLAISSKYLHDLELNDEYVGYFNRIKKHIKYKKLEK